MPELANAPLASDAPLVERARAALGEHRWRDAYDLLTEADRTGSLAPDELELLAQASWWVGRLPDAIAARERAYAGYVKAGNDVMAAATAGLVARDNLLRNAHSVARAWLSRGERLAASFPEGRVHGWLEATRALEESLGGRFEAALERATRAYEIARRVGDHDLEAISLSNKGFTLIQLGQVDEGLALIDEATVSAVAGEIEPLNAGAVSCTTIGACASLGDWTRAGQWIEAQDRWCQREHINGFPGMCRLHRAEAKRIHGAWTEAETEARRAHDELEGFIPAAIGVALYEIGVIRLRRGDLPAAEDALLRAHARGRDPEPALSLLRLAQGRIEEAQASIRRAIEEPPTDTAWATAVPNSALNRLALLPAQVEIALAAGDAATARTAADAMAALAERFPSEITRASATTVQGQVALAEGDATAAAAMFRNAIAQWGEVGAPWERARAQVSLAAALAAEGDRVRAGLELRAARATFTDLGAVPDVRRTDEALAALEPDTERGGDQPGRARRATRVVRTFAFTDIVDSTKLASVLGDEAWEGVIVWHDGAIRSIVAEHSGEVVKATGDGFFLAFARADEAVDAAIAIQRRFDDQRRTQGFVPAVRIGLHEAEAGRSGLDYVGGGVNEAARIGAAAGGGEILVSASTFARAGSAAREAGRRTVELKGIERPVEVVSIDWR